MNGVFEEQEREFEKEPLFKEIIEKNFSELRSAGTQIPEDQKVPEK